MKDANKVAMMLVCISFSWILSGCGVLLGSSIGHAIDVKNANASQTKHYDIQLKSGKQIDNIAIYYNSDSSGIRAIRKYPLPIDTTIKTVDVKRKTMRYPNDARIKGATIGGFVDAIVIIAFAYSISYGLKNTNPYENVPIGGD